jgi:thioredoxin-like negative regulator of GroEL
MAVNLCLVSLLAISMPPSMRQAGGGGSGSSSGHGPGMSLDVFNFESAVGSSKEAWLVEVGSAKCGSCLQFAPTWASIVQNFGTEVNMGAVNIDEADGMKLAQQLGALSRGIPQLIFFGKDDGSGGKTLMAGHPADYADASALLRNELVALAKDASGKALKAGGRTYSLSDPEADHRGQAIALDEAGDTAGAVASFRAAAKFAPGVSGNWFNLAQALLDAGEDEHDKEAFQCLQSAVKLDPTNTEAKEFLDKLGSNLGLDEL